MKLTDVFANHPKVRPLADGAFRIWVTMIAYSNRYGLGGVISRKQIDDELPHVRARTHHIHSLIRARLWHELDTSPTRVEHESDTNSTRVEHELSTSPTRVGHDPDTRFEIHDIADYQPASATSAELSAKRSDAGKKGAAARWGDDGKLPLAKDAPVPSRPVPTRPDPSLERDLSRLSDLEAWGYRDGRSYGPISGAKAALLSRLLPIPDHELEAVAKTTGRSWAYFGKVIESYREEAARPAPDATEKPDRHSIGGMPENTPNAAAYIILNPEAGK